MTEQVGDSIWLRTRPDSALIPAKFVVQHGQNTALVTPVALPEGGLRLAHANQWSSRPENAAPHQTATVESEGPVEPAESGTGDHADGAGVEPSVQEPCTVGSEALPSSAIKTAERRDRYELRPRRPVCYRV
jgi:hypothetical protein